MKLGMQSYWNSETWGGGGEKIAEILREAETSETFFLNNPKLILLLQEMNFIIYKTVLSDVFAKFVA